MRRFLYLTIALSMILVSGCSERNTDKFAAQSAVPGPGGSRPQGQLATTTAVNADQEDSKGLPTKTVSFDSTGNPPAAQAGERKIIRNADLEIESKTSSDDQRRIASLVESHGGFVITTEASQTGAGQPGPNGMTIKLVARVPSAQFGAVIEAIHSMGGSIKQEKITGQDVTEEFYDLDARIKSKKALEAQFLEIMKQAHSIQDALNVQTQLSDVRTEIEKLEGRQRFLENQSSLSTITITFEPPIVPGAAVSRGFIGEAKSALNDGVDAAAAIVLFLLRAAIALVPLFLFIVLPIWFLLRNVIKRNRKVAVAQQITPDVP